MLTPYPPTPHAQRIGRRRSPSGRPLRVLATALACVLMSLLLQACGGGPDDCPCPDNAADACATQDHRTPPPNTPALCAANPTACI